MHITIWYSNPRTERYLSLECCYLDMSVRVQLLLILLFYRHCEKLDGLCLSEMIARYPKISNIKRWNARELWMMFQASCAISRKFYDDGRRIGWWFWIYFLVALRVCVFSLSSIFRNYILILVQKLYIIATENFLLLFNAFLYILVILY